MKELGYYNGRYGELSEMMIPMNDRVCYFGDGVYEAAMSRNYHIFALDEHVDRFFNSAGLLKIALPCTKDELRATLDEMLHKMDTGNLFVYWQATRGTAPRNHAFPPASVPANLWITLKPMEMTGLEKPIQLITLEDTRFLHCNIKTLNLIPSVIAAQKAAEAGCGEAVLHRGERVTECAHSNVSILQDGMLKTAPADNLILPGIARAHLISACKRLGVPVNETAFTLEELREAEEILVTSTTKICLAADRIDGRPAGGKRPDLVKQLQAELLREYIEETE